MNTHDALGRRRDQNRSVTRRPPIERTLATAPPEALFLLSAISQYIGAAIAVSLFDEVAPQTVAWFRTIGAAVALLAVSPGFHRGWTRKDLVGAAVFGIATVLMNVCFYLGIDRIDLGKSVAIEFIGPIVVAAVTTRSVRNGAALSLAVVGVVTLGGVEISDNALGVFFILMSSALWAAYIVVGSRVANTRPGVAGLGVGLAIGSIFITPIGAPGSGPVWVSPTLLLLCCATGVFSNAIGYGIDQYVMRRIPIRRFSVMLAALPVTAAFIGWVALDQRPGALDLAGIALVLIGVAIQEREELIGLPEPG
jgi:inner membrane transporter RhtA